MGVVDVKIMSIDYSFVPGCNAKGGGLEILVCVCLHVCMCLYVHPVKFVDAASWKPLDGFVQSS